MGARTRTVLHGIDQARASDNRPAQMHDGHILYETDTKCCRVGDSVDEEWLPLVVLGFTYDVDEDGGDIGPIGLARARVPAGTIIVAGCIDVIETFESSSDTATIAISTEAADDIVAAVAINNGTPWDAGLHAVVPVLSDPTKWIKASADRDIRITVGVEKLTKGRLRGFLLCFNSEQEVTEEESTSSSSTSSDSSSESSSDSTSDSSDSSSST